VAEDPDETGVVSDGKKVTYTDVYAFSERINTFIKDPNTAVDNENQILSIFQTLLEGLAILW
jgi:ABC-type antimicrobial peptide transport system ATPase subunit